MAYLHGSVWRSGNRYHHFHVLLLDYDGGAVGHTLKHAYECLQSPRFPSLILQNATDYSTPQAAVEAVRRGTWWTAVYANPGASATLDTALHGDAAAPSYDTSQALAYVWNEVRYPPFADQGFRVNFERLALATRQAYHALYGPSAAQFIGNTSTASALDAFLNPIGISGVNNMPIPQGTKLFYNTVTMVMPHLQQFFFLLTLNSVSDELQLYIRLPVLVSGLVRPGLSVVYDLVAALCMTGYIWAFSEDWRVTGTQFVLTWMLLWLLNHIHFVVLDTMTALLPSPAIPFVLLTWIVGNITASISPFELNPAFYRWGYAFPANEAYTTLTDI